jgi:hypothetical protein
LALSLDDLKKKKPSVSKRVSLDVEMLTPQRKKLSPWQSIEQKEQVLPESDSKPLNSESVKILTDAPVQSAPILTESQIQNQSIIVKPMLDVNSDTSSDLNSASVQVQTVNTPSNVESLPNKDSDSKKSAPEIHSFDSLGKINLNEQESILKPPCASMGDSMVNFKFEAVSEGTLTKEHRSDTEVTQKKHRSDTISAGDNIEFGLKNTSPNEEEVTQKKHRSDTNRTNKSDSVAARCDTEVTQTYDLDLVNLFNGDISDTEVTQFEEKTRRSQIERSDTDLTQTQLSKGIEKVPQKAISYNKERQRSDTDLTQFQTSTYFFANSPEDLTQKKHRSDTEVTPYKTQKRHKEVTQILSTSDAQIHEKQIHILRGNQLSLFNFICESLLSTGENTMQTSYEYLALQTRINIGSIKTTAKRLRDSQLLDISAFGGGKGASIQIIVTDLVLKIFARKFKARSNTEVTQNTHEKRHRSDTIQDTNAPSKLVSNLNNNLLPSTQVTQPIQVNQPDPTQDLDVSAINIQHLGRFNIYRKQIQDIKNQKLNFSTTSLQDFVDRFVIYASDSKNVRNVMSLPAIFVKMAQSASKGQDPLIDIETDTDRIVRERLEELVQKRQERHNRQNQLLELEFETWIDGLQQQARDSLAPPTPLMKSGSVAQTMTLKNHFIEQIWPELAADLGL